MSRFITALEQCLLERNYNQIVINFFSYISAKMKYSLVSYFTLSYSLQLGVLVIGFYIFTILYL